MSVDPDAPTRPKFDRTALVAVLPFPPGPRFTVMNTLGGALSAAIVTALILWWRGTFAAEEIAAATAVVALCFTLAGWLLAWLNRIVTTATIDSDGVLAPDGVDGSSRFSWKDVEAVAYVRSRLGKPQSSLIIFPRSRWFPVPASLSIPMLEDAEQRELHMILGKLSKLHGFSLLDEDSAKDERLARKLRWLPPGGDLVTNDRKDH
jgi:hypothetical protein